MSKRIKSVLIKNTEYEGRQIIFQNYNQIKFIEKYNTKTIIYLFISKPNI